MKITDLMNILSIAPLLLFVFTFYRGYRNPSFHKKISSTWLAMFVIFSSCGVYLMIFYDFSLLISALIVVIQISSTATLCAFAGSMVRAYKLQKAASADLV